MRTKFFTLIFACIPFLCWTQRPWEAGGGIGTAYYFGDLDRFPSKLGLANPGLTLNLRRNACNYFTFRANVLLSSLSGNDKHKINPVEIRQRGFKFFSPLFEGSLVGEIYPFGIFKKVKSDDAGVFKFGSARVIQVLENGDTLVSDARYRAFMPYLLAGAGAAYSDPRVNWNHQSSEAISADQAISYPRINFVLPFGGGFRIGLNERTTLGFEATWRATYSDYIDGVSKAGNPDKNDWYFTAMLTLSRSFGKTDRDKDGVADSDDRCPNIPGTAQTNGCPDADMDGIPDHADQCPNESGSPRAKGCPDVDNDGIADTKDACPGIFGTLALNGCPDKDGDGITDQEDQCPTFPGTVEKKGCPEQNAMAVAAGFPEYRAVYFDAMNPLWYESSLLTLDEIVQILNQDPNLMARLDGHTDDSSDGPSGQLLSEQRAKKCYDYLLSKGIAANRLTYSGFAGKRPVGNNATAHDPKINRRVEVHFYK